MGRKQIAAERTRRKIMEASEKLIAARGFDNVTVDEITAEAGVSKGSFYTYFKRKEDVVGEIAHEHFETVRARSDELESGVCDKIAAFLTESMKYIVKSGVKLSQQWLKCGMEPELTTDVSNKFAYDMRVVREILEAAVKSGELAPETPAETIARLVTAEYYGAVTCWSLTDGTLDPLELLENYCAVQLRPSLREYEAGERTESAEVLERSLSVEEMVLEQSGKFWNALEAADTEGMRAVAAPSCMFVHIGATCGLEEEMRCFTDKVFVPTGVKINSQTTNVYGDAAVVITDCNYALLLNNEETTHHFAVTEVYIRMDGAWKLAQLSFTALVY